MKKGHKLLTIALWGVLILTLNVVVVAFAWERWHAQPVSNLPVLMNVPHFALVDQDGRAVSDQDLHGKTWVAAFIFTGCADTCPMMSKKMEGLQDAIHAPGVNFVSFTVDPERDTPAVLKTYAKRFNADPNRWKFLTGTPQQMKDVAYGMGVAVQPASGDDPILHSTHFLLIDAAGRVRGVYDTKDAVPEKSTQQLARDAAELAKSRID
jgi:protein SCO1/2